MGQPLEDLDALEARLSYEFRDRTLLEQALTHKSHRPDSAEGNAPLRPSGRGPGPDTVGTQGFSNERLEFLGDAVLGTVVAAYLYATHPDWSEGDLTKVKAAAVSEATLSRIGLELGLGEFLRLGKGEEQSGGRSRPSLLADVLEALIGAVFVDRGGHEAGRFPVPQFVLQILGRALEAIEEHDHPRDYKTALQEATQEAHHLLPAYKVVDESGPDHAKTFVVEVRLGDRMVGVGEGRSKKEAEQNAARQALADPEAGLAPPG